MTTQCKEGSAVKMFRVFVILLMVAMLSMTIFAVGADAASKKKVKTEYMITVNYNSNLITVFTKKESQIWWKMVWRDKCSTPNPYWQIPEGVYTIWRKKSSFKFDGEKCKYGICFGCDRMHISAPPKFKKDDWRTLGTACTMGQIWVSSSRARWLYKNIPKGTKVYIHYSDTPL